MKNGTLAILMGAVAIAIAAGTFCISGCRKTDGKTDGKDTTVVKPAVSVFAKGADISWVTEMEAAGRKFYDASGTQTECFALMKSLGMNSIRLRVFVNPSDGWCNQADVVAKAKRAAALGMRVMIDFHYSDVWADPGHQTKPSAWTDLSVADLKTALSTHTKDVLNALKSAGVTPEWVQVGNETSDGFLWETCRASKDMANYAAVTEAGYEAVKSVFPNAKVIVHIDNGWDKVTHFTWIFDGLKDNGCKWDVIGMSLYPTAANYGTYVASCIKNIQTLYATYKTPVMIAEVGFAVGDPTNAKTFLTDLMTKAKALGIGQCLGVFYWEPECDSNWKAYKLGAFDDSGKPTAALDAFAN
jgi:arabinogalactan endo-1,4-beta-galactosidase